MMNHAEFGFLAVVAAAVMQGSFALPQKFIRGWPWEKNWLLYSIFAGRGRRVAMYLAKPQAGGLVRRGSR
jgi:hypothetical protein